MTTMTAKNPTLWTSGDWNAFFGFGTNILVNLLVITGLLRFVLKSPRLQHGAAGITSGGPAPASRKGGTHPRTRQIMNRR